MLMLEPKLAILDETDSEQSTFVGFVKNIMPDLYEENEQMIVVDTLNKLYPQVERKEKEA